MSERDKRDAARFRYLIRLANKETTATRSYFWITVDKEFRSGTWAKPGKATNYRTLRGAIDRMMRDERKYR